MKKIILLSFVIIIQSCAGRILPLHGNYQEGPVKSKIERPVSVVWESIIDLIAESGLSIQLIDKESGLVLSETSNFWGMISQEDNKGRIINPKAYIVAERRSSDFPKESLPFYEAFAKWTVRAKVISPGTTVVSLSMHVQRVDNTLEKAAGSGYRRGKSTGNFEKWFLDEVVSRSEK